MAPNVEKIIQSISLGDQDAVQLLLDNYNTQYAECFFFNTEAQERKKQQRLEEVNKSPRQSCADNEFTPSYINLKRCLNCLVTSSLCVDGCPPKAINHVFQSYLDTSSLIILPCVDLHFRSMLQLVHKTVLNRNYFFWWVWFRADSGKKIQSLNFFPSPRGGHDVKGVTYATHLVDDPVAASLSICSLEDEPHVAGSAAKFPALELENASLYQSSGGNVHVELSALLWLPQERGVLVLTSALEQRLVLRWTDGNQLIPDSTSSPVSKEVSQDVIEILKIIFNVAHRLYRQEPDEEEAALYRRLAAVLHHCLLLSCDGADTLEELQGHTVNILSALPLTCLDVLLAVPVGQASHKYEGVNMDCVHALVLFMDRRLNRGQKLKEKLTPVLSLLTESSRVHRETRHYLRQKILPPLKDVAVRPEQDSTLRGQLVRLMTHVDTDVKDCAAELLFVLCKENVSRFVKYTGYGNAAGLLAARGLLNGRRNSGDGQFASHYSSDSDSDTEEYRQARSKINLVTGRVEAEQPDPMEGMTEEEKEKEACRLICMINRLSQDQIIQPMSVTRDGRLAPLWGHMRSCTEEKEEEHEEEEQGLSSMPQGLKDKTMK
ncbi:PREDICTED: synembryn-A-like [Poecilia mexicana]|uniref:synembryn-A-like n=1 Tax=Poecilia mexicana TaxID=48701 RepID=UPI00072EA0A7|nr:PREDICTED: synembryn-A-like [Poecilia mexicana]